MPDRVSQQKKFGRRGVYALFSSQESQSRTGLTIGIAALAVGLVLWTVYVVGVARPGSLGLSSLNPFVSLFLPPVGLFLVISGTGIALSFRAWPRSATIDELAVEQQAQDTRPRDQDEKSVIPEINNQGVPQQRSTVQLSVTVFIESVIIILLYAGVLDEYQANLSMRDWVRLALPSLQIFLNQEALTIFSGILALMVIRFLPGKKLHN